MGRFMKFYSFARVIRAVLFGAASLALVSCAATGGPLGLSKQQQMALGQQEHPKIVAAFGGEMQDPQLNAYVDNIVRRLLAASDRPQEPITVTVLDSPIVNAMALPGYVYVTRGLLALANSEAELAGVLGHEIGHIFEQHTAERVSRSNLAGLGAVAVAILTGSQDTAQLAQQGAQLYLLKFNRGQEYEADRVGVALLGRAGYDPLGEAGFLNTLNRWSEIERQIAGVERPPEFLATHPNTAERVRRAAEEAQVLNKGGEVGRERYLSSIDGIIFGDDPATQGFIRGNAFYHPGLRLGFAVPQGVQLQNSSTAVIGRAQNGAQMQFTGAASQNGPAALVTQIGQQLKVDLGQPRGFNANGRNGAYGQARANTQGGAVDVQIYAIQWSGASHYVFMWLTPANVTSQMQRSIQQSVQSIRDVDPRSMQTPPTRRVDVATIQSRDTFNGLAQLNRFDNAVPQRFAAINGYTSESDVKAGKRVKIVR